MTPKSEGNAISGSNSTGRVRAALLAASHRGTILAFPNGTRTSAGAAAAVGCNVAQIAQSMVFPTRDTDPSRLVLALTSGAN